MVTTTTTTKKKIKAKKVKVLSFAPYKMKAMSSFNLIYLVILNYASVVCPGFHLAYGILMWEFICQDLPFSKFKEVSV